MHASHRRLTALLLLMLLLFTACGKTEPPPVPAPAPPPVTVPKPAEKPAEPPEEPPKPAFTSAFTGLPVSQEVARARPISVMINNNRRALPHYGISHAALYIEILAEAEIDRIMPVFDDYATIPKLGSVRSARDYFIDYAHALDSVFLHFGGSPQAYISLKKNKIPNLNGIEDPTYYAVYHTDQAIRKKNGLEHSRFADGEGIQKGFALKNLETTNKGQTFFTWNDTPVAPGTLPADYLEAPFSRYITPSFAYHSQDQLYYRSQFGEKHIDAENGEQLAVTNLLFLYAPHKTVDGEGRREVKTTGEGPGYYISQGKACPITWSKKSFDDWLTFQKDGAPLALNRGKTWICILPDSKQEETVLR